MTANLEPNQDSEPSVVEPGSVVGARFRVAEVLGDGASGVVYLAECVAELTPGDSAQLRPGQRVALKVIHRHLAKDRQVSRRFDREARILRKLRGPNLVPLLDFGHTPDGLLYMALEHVEGTPLDVLVRRDRLPPTRAVEVVRQICCALDVAHGAGIIHRDLKPGNVILQSQEDGTDLVRVLDFGLAKLLRADASQSLTALTQQNMVFGTPEYMAPEQARGDEVDERCDVYASGIILYELLTGRVPFSGPNPIGVMTSHLTDDVEAPSSRAPEAGIPPALDAVVLHALAKSPKDRYPSSTALATALGSALRRPRDVASTAPPPADYDIGTRDTELSLEKPELPERVSATAEPKASRMWIVVAIVAALLGIAAGLGISGRF
jgi:serine/threonine protein kinase